ncbi:MAG: class I SAM-dependent methyltransferase [Cyanobacteria bacterium J06626_6]
MQIKSVLRKLGSNSLLDRSSYLYSTLRKNQITRSRQRFERNLKRAPQSPQWLDQQALKFLNRQYPVLTGKLDAHASTSENRSKSRASRILTFISEAAALNKLNDCLELGCGDGMVSYFMHTQGKNTTAIDSYSEGFSKRATEAGVNCIAMDAASLQFDSESFDFVFSYDSFEHFADPQRVLQEATRVLRPGGYIYLDFEPLYMSPFGLHSWELVNIPYCHLLFPTEMLQNFVGEKGHEFFSKVDTAINQWRLKQFRSLWQQFSDRLKTADYQEIYTIKHLGLIHQYPDVFTSKTDLFDDLICSRIQAILQKI